MSDISRRDLLFSGLALSASSLVARSAWARAATAVTDSAAAEALAAVAPREHLLFDFDWKFTFGNGVDPAKDLGFGYGKATSPRPANSNLRKRNSTIPAGAL